MAGRKRDKKFDQVRAYRDMITQFLEARGLVLTVNLMWQHIPPELHIHITQKQTGKTVATFIVQATTSWQHVSELELEMMKPVYDGVLTSYAGWTSQG